MHSRTRNSRQKGRSGEDRAVRFLESQGYRVVDRNWYGLRGEIDIVAQKSTALHFVEVKAWASADISFVEQSVNPRKLGRLKQTAAEYLADHPIFSNSPVQFDLVFIDKSNDSLELIEGII